MENYLFKVRVLFVQKYRNKQDINIKTEKEKNYNKIIA